MEQSLIKSRDNLMKKDIPRTHPFACFFIAFFIVVAYFVVEMQEAVRIAIEAIRDSEKIL